MEMFIRAFLAVAGLANAYLSCPGFCELVSSGHISALRRTECNCDNRNQINVKIFNTHPNGLKTSTMKDNPTSLEAAQLSPYSLSFIDEPFYWIKPIVYYNKNQDLANQIFKRYGHDNHNRVNNKTTLLNNTEKRNNVVIGEVDIETDEFPLYLDIYKTGHVELGVKGTKIENINVRALERAINECIDLHILFNLRKPGNSSKDINGNKYSILSDSDLMATIKGKCELPIQIINQSLEEINMSLPTKYFRKLKSKILNNKHFNATDSTRSKLDTPSQKDQYEIRLHTNKKSSNKNGINSNNNRRFLPNITEILNDPNSSTTRAVNTMFRDNVDIELTTFPASNLLALSTLTIDTNRIDSNKTLTLRDLIEAPTNENSSKMFSAVQSNLTTQNILTPNMTSPSTVEPNWATRMQTRLTTPANKNEDLFYSNNNSSSLYNSNEAYVKDKKKNETSVNITSETEGKTPKSPFSDALINTDKYYANNIQKPKQLRPRLSTNFEDFYIRSTERATMVALPSEEYINNDYIFIPPDLLSPHHKEEIETTVMPEMLNIKLLEIENATTNSDLEAKVNDIVQNSKEVEVVNDIEKDIKISNFYFNDFFKSIGSSEKVSNLEKKNGGVDKNTKVGYLKIKTPYNKSNEFEVQTKVYVDEKYIKIPDSHIGIFKPNDRVSDSVTLSNQYNEINASFSTEHNTEFTISADGSYESSDFLYDDFYNIINNKTSQDIKNLKKQRLNVTEIKTTRDSNNLGNKIREALNFPNKQRTIIDYHLEPLTPKILTIEYANNTVVSMINGTEALDYYGSNSNNNLEDNNGKDNAAEIVGSLAFIFENHTIPARFVQTSGDKIKLGIDGLTLCQQIAKNGLRNSLLLSALCNCSSVIYNNCSNI